MQRIDLNLYELWFGQICLSISHELEISVNMVTKESKTILRKVLYKFVNFCLAKSVLNCSVQ